MIHDFDLAFGAGSQEHEVIFNRDGKEYSMRRLIETIDTIECKTCVTEGASQSVQQQLRDLQTQLDALSTQMQSMSQILDKFRAALY